VLERAPVLITPITLGIVAAVMIIIGYDMDHGPLSTILAVTGVILTGSAVVLFVDWIWHRAGHHYRAIQDLRARTAQVRIMELVNQMTPEQIAYANSLQFVIKLLPGEPAPVVYALQIGDVSVPIDFVRYFISMSDDVYLPPIRQWQDGSLNRQYAVYLTNHLISLGYANPAAGNHAATWIDKARALRSMGLLPPEEQVNELVTLDYISRLQARRSREQRHQSLRE
jgi:hypothetical protein